MNQFSAWTTQLEQAITAGYPYFLREMGVVGYVQAFGCYVGILTDGSQTNWIRWDHRHIRGITLDTELLPLCCHDWYLVGYDLTCHENLITLLLTRDPLHSTNAHD
jgi:hypothetical protein